MSNVSQSERVSNVIGLEIAEINMFSAGFPETIDLIETKMKEILPAYKGERSATVCHILCEYADLGAWYKLKVNLMPCFHQKITLLDIDGATPPRRYSISAYAALLPDRADLVRKVLTYAVAQINFALRDGRLRANRKRCRGIVENAEYVCKGSVFAALTVPPRVPNPLIPSNSTSRRRSRAIPARSTRTSSRNRGTRRGATSGRTSARAPARR